MRAGAKAAALVFAGVAAVMGGLAWLLLSAGRDESASGGATKSPAERAAIAKRRREPPPLPPMREPPVSVKPASKSTARFEVAGHPELAKRDWKEIAAAWLDVVDHPRAMFEGRGPDMTDPKTMERLQEINERWTRAAGVPIEGMEKIPPLPPEHPAFAANLIAAILEMKGAPLTDEQGKRIADLVRVQAEATDAADAEFKRINELQPADRRTFMVDVIADRAKTADAFYDPLAEILTPRQAEILAPSEYRGRSSFDPLSSGRWWGLSMNPLPMTDPDECARDLASKFAAQFQLADREATIRDVLAAWLAAAPTDPFDRAEERGAFTRRRCVLSRQRMSELVHSLVNALDSDPEKPLPAPAKANLRDFATVFVPFRVQKPNK